MIEEIKIVMLFFLGTAAGAYTGTALAIWKDKRNRKHQWDRLDKPCE